MLIADLKLALGFCIVCTATAYYYDSKDNNKWGERLLPNRHRPVVTTTTKDPVTSENDIYYENLKLRHHSRYPNLERVMQKIDNMQAEGNKKTLVLNRVRHNGWQTPYRTTTVRTTTTTEEDLFEDYGAMVDGEEEEYDGGDNLEEEYEDDEMTNDDDYDDPFSDDSEWQAEEATEPPVQRPTTTSTFTSVSSFGQYKWDTLGTRTGVEQSRKQQLHLKPSHELKVVTAAVQHYMRVQEEGQCRRPVPKVISVQREHPDPTKTYTPHCTILHRCAEDTGCCTKRETRCGPKKQVPVHLFFYTKTLGSPQTKVEGLTFYNHTECACMEIAKISSDTTTSTQNRLEEDGNIGLAYKSALAPSPEDLRCLCPELFTPRYRYGSRCNCDCEENNEDCHRMKKGKEYFSLKDRQCIQDDQCGIPLCEYGVYNRTIGRCQLKREKLDSYRRMPMNN